ncbi:MAG: hypothetical protein KJ621_15560 [Proteobacteria bacterium]|nr:hypothetical protein [Pseudomonadota bacterium]MBU1742459.1 hypothetical protein [Pseudomonadota bacterium]
MTFPEELMMAALRFVAERSECVKDPVRLGTMGEELQIDEVTRRALAVQLARLGYLTGLTQNAQNAAITAKGMALLEPDNPFYRHESVSPSTHVRVTDSQGVAVATGHGATAIVNIDQALQVLERAIEQADISPEQKQTLRQKLTEWLGTARDFGVNLGAGLAAKWLGG